MSCDKSQCTEPVIFHAKIVLIKDEKMEKPRPYLTAALFCERVLQEKDESITVVRIADKINYGVQFIPPVGVTAQSPPLPMKPVIDIQGLISIKSGPVTGDHALKIVTERPDGQRRDVATHPVKLLGKDHGVSLILHLGLIAELDGLYWFDVLFDDEVLTRVPLIIIPAPAPGQAQAELKP